MKKDVLFIMGMGGPDSIEAIEPFLFNLFSDRDIINFHVGNILQKFIAKKIAAKRSKKLSPEYLKILYRFNRQAVNGYRSKLLLSSIF